MKYLKVAPLFLSFFAFFLYLLTAAPFMLWLDAPRFVSAIVTLGVSNPPEPLYILLAHPFTYLPFGSVIFKIQLFSALTAALSLFVLYKIILLILKNLADIQSRENKRNKIVRGLSAFFGTAMLAFSYQFWSQAQNIETFTLVVLIESLVLFLLITATSRRRFFLNLSLIALLLGLATGTNPVIASIIPTILWVMWRRHKFVGPERLGTWFLIGVLAVVAIHLYIPIRAAANPFLNYWKATSLESIWNLSTGAGLNVYVPELGRINGFTGSPEVFFKSTWHFIAMWLVKFTPLLLPFIVAGSIYLWKKSRYYFVFLFLIITTNWLFSALYFSGNQEAWFLVSDVAWVVLAGVGYFAIVSGAEQIFSSKFARLKILKSFASPKYLPHRLWLVLLIVVPLIFWFPALNRRGWTLTGEYIQNLYKPIGEEKAIIFGSSDLFDSVSYFVHDVPGTSVYKPKVVPVTDNMFYIFGWYRDNLSFTNPELKMPDGSKLKYDSAEEYSKFVNEFFELNLQKYKIYLTSVAIRNNFLQVYEPQGQEQQGGSLKIDDKFKLIPRGMLVQVVAKDAKFESDPQNFEYQLKNGFPKNKPTMLERTFKTELAGMVNEYAYSFENMGDELLKIGKYEDAFKFYQAAFDFNPKNAEIISRLGNYYGNIGNHKKAIEYFEKALKIEPRNIGLLFNLSIAYENTGKIDKAISNLNKVLQITKPNSEVGQLAKKRLDVLKQATASAQTATASGSLQQQLLPPQIPEGFQVYQNKQLKLQFIYPKAYTVTDAGSDVRLTNGLTGKDELTFNFSSRKMSETEELEALAENLPFKVEGVPLGSQPVAIAGFQAVGKTYGSGEHLTFLLLLRRNDWGITIKVYPGDSNKSNEFNQILSSLRSLE